MKILDEEFLDNFDQILAFRNQVADDGEDEQACLDPQLRGFLLKELAVLELKKHGVSLRDFSGAGAFDGIAHNGDG